MPKEWILNSAANRFQFNYSRNVGAVSEAIRKCAPKNVEEWEDYYYRNIKPKEHLIELGKRLYIKISEVLTSEIEEVTEDDCINYLIDLVIRRTYDGYHTEIRTIYGQLERTLGMKIAPAPDEWDRLYNVDFFIQVNDKYIGLQIKPATDTAHISQIYKEREIQKNTHDKFTENYGGHVFYVISVKKDKQKHIQNIDIIDEIKVEIARLMKQ
jgi:hypothetical protein